MNVQQTAVQMCYLSKNLSPKKELLPILAL